MNFCLRPIRDVESLERIYVMCSLRFFVFATHLERTHTHTPQLEFTGIALCFFVYVCVFCCKDRVFRISAHKVTESHQCLPHSELFCYLNYYYFQLEDKIVQLTWLLSSISIRYIHDNSCTIFAVLRTIESSIGTCM